MSVGFRHISVFLCLLGLALPAVSLAQEQASQQDNSAKPTTSKDLKKRQKRLYKELSDPDKIWVDYEVPDIITPDEKKAYLDLSTNEERDQFREIFWDRRNPDPESPTNAFKEEHYRRLAYADEHFASGIPGRKTDRGHIYIIWGPPDEIDSHPTGGTYQRSPQQGGGESQAYAWEVWRYRHLEGVGENIEIEFVDPSGSGEYHIAFDPCEKDALSHVPGAGLSLSEIMGASTKANRFTNSNGTTCPMPIGGMTASADEFDLIERNFKVQHAPEHFKDLIGMVSSRIVANPLPFTFRADFLRATSNTVLVPITVQLRNRDLRFQGRQGLQSAVLDVYGRITDPGGRIVQTFEDVISRDFPESLFAASLELSSIYQKSVPLRSGLYRLDLVIKDTHSGNIGIQSTALRVPRYEEGKLDASSLILADGIEPVAAKVLGAGQFVLGAYKVRPRLSQEFSSSDKLGIYLQLYNLQRDADAHKTKVSVAYRITNDQQEVWRAVETADHLHQGGEQLTIERYIPVGALAPGRYTIEVTAIDLLSNETVIRTTEFTVKPPTTDKPGAAKPAPIS
ncbi:MAG TPA: GWxTD domain-containing protein [Candidatus Angelobacter sp.]|nr:GWxTD domain-containing protein [Candidatus Angelobacter sp.]